MWVDSSLGVNLFGRLLESSSRQVSSGWGRDRETCDWPWGTRERGGLLSLPLVCAIDLQAPFLTFSVFLLLSADILISTHLPPPFPHLLCISISQHLVHCLRLSLAVLSWQVKGQSLPPSKDDLVLL